MFIADTKLPHSDKTVSPFLIKPDDMPWSEVRGIFGPQAVKRFRLGRMAKGTWVGKSRKTDVIQQGSPALVVLSRLMMC